MTAIQTQTDNNKQYKSYNSSNTSLIEANTLEKILFGKEIQVKALLESVMRRADPIFMENLIRAFHITIMRDDKLRQTSKESIVKALYFCAEKALLPTGGKVWLLPYKGQCSAQIGVQGYRELLRRNPQIIRVGGDLVREKDEFNYTSGTNPSIHHIPNHKEDSPVIGAYAYAEMKGTDKCAIRYCTMKDINRSKSESKSLSREDSPWNKHPDEMIRLVPLKKLAKELMIETETYVQTSTESKSLAIVKEDSFESIDQNGEVFNPEDYDNYEPELGNIEDSNNYN